MKTAATAAAAATLVPTAATAQAEANPFGKARLKLGFDNFSIRALKWKAAELISYAEKQKVDVLLISDLDTMLDADGTHSADHLKLMGAMSRDAGIELQVGTLAICPTSTKFNNRWGTAEEHLRLLLKVAKGAGSNVARCVLGFGEDRRTPGGIEARIKDTVEVLKKVRSQAVGDGIKIAVENHAGDMQAWELQGLIEGAGKDFVGCTIDSGNATWTLEDPQNNLEILAPYILTSGIRDTMMWKTDTGASVAWTAMGEGLIDWKPYFATWAERCPERPVVLEIISGFSKPFPYLKKDFWEAFSKIRPHEFAAWLALERKGHEIPPFRASAAKTDAQFQLEDLEKSLRYAKETLGLGRKA